MRYYHKPSGIDIQRAWRIEICKHPVFRRATCFEKDGKGIWVIQQYFNEDTRRCWWDAVEPELADDIYACGAFETVFSLVSFVKKSGQYPVIPVRKLMWELRMKPLKREFWEDFFKN